MPTTIGTRIKDYRGHPGDAGDPAKAPPSDSCGSRRSDSHGWSFLCVTKSLAVWRRSPSRCLTSGGVPDVVILEPLWPQHTWLADHGGGCCRARKYAPGPPPAAPAPLDAPGTAYLAGGPARVPAVQRPDRERLGPAADWMAHDRTRPDATVRPELDATRSAKVAALVRGVCWWSPGTVVRRVGCCTSLPYSGLGRDREDGEFEVLDSAGALGVGVSSDVGGE